MAHDDKDDDGDEGAGAARAAATQTPPKTKRREPSTPTDAASGHNGDTGGQRHNTAGGATQPLPTTR
eukprot:gene10918-7766_t